MTPLRGIFAAMCTPFDETGEHVDDVAYLAHIDRMIDAGLHGLVLCSGTGEYAYLRPEEKRLLIEKGARHVDGRIPTIAQTTALSTAEAVELAKHAEGCGVNALMVMPPYLEAPGERGVLYHYETIARAVAIAVVMYSVPAQTGVDITPDLYRKLIAAGQHAEALVLWDGMKTIALWLWENDQGVDYLTGVKAATRLSGVDMGPARRPLPPMPALARQAIGQALSRLSDGPLSTERLAWCARLETRDEARFNAR